MARLDRERRAQRTGKLALERMDVGRAECLAALAALIGLAAPALSGVQMLRDFGLAAAIGGAVALAGMALLVPAAIALSEQPQPMRLPRTGRAAVAALARRRAPRVSDPRDPFAREREQEQEPARPARPVFDRRRGAVPGDHRLCDDQLLQQDHLRAAGLRAGDPAAEVRRTVGHRNAEGRRERFPSEACRVQRAATRSGSATTSTGRSCWSRGSASAAGTASRSSTCVERVARPFPEASRSSGSTSAIRRARRARRSPSTAGASRWRVDRDGAVGTLYGVGVGPTTFFAYPGGVLMITALGELTSEELTRVEVRRLIAGLRQARSRDGGGSDPAGGPARARLGRAGAARASSRASGCATRSSRAARDAARGRSSSACDTSPTGCTASGC